MSILYIELLESFDGFTNLILDTQGGIESLDDFFDAELVIPHLYERTHDIHGTWRSIFVSFLFLFFGEIDRTLEVNDDLLGSFLTNSWNTREELIVFELYRLHELLSPESEECESRLPTDAIDPVEFTKEGSLFRTLESIE